MPFTSADDAHNTKSGRDKLGPLNELIERNIQNWMRKQDTTTSVTIVLTAGQYRTFVKFQEEIEHELSDAGWDVTPNPGSIDSPDVSNVHFVEPRLTLHKKD